MINLVLTPRAELDLEEIYIYTFVNWGEIQSDKYQDDFYAAMQQLLQNNELGQIYSHSKFDYRKFLVNRHLLFY